MKYYMKIDTTASTCLLINKDTSVDVSQSCYIVWIPSVFVFQQLLSLQEKLVSKEAELEQAREEHRYLEGEVLTLRDKVCTPSHIRKSSR